MALRDKGKGWRDEAAEKVYQEYSQEARDLVDQLEPIWSQVLKRGTLEDTAHLPLAVGLKLLNEIADLVKEPEPPEEEGQGRSNPDGRGFGVLLMTKRMRKRKRETVVLLMMEDDEEEEGDGGSSDDEEDEEEEEGDGQVLLMTKRMRKRKRETVVLLMTKRMTKRSDDEEDDEEEEGDGDLTMKRKRKRVHQDLTMKRKEEGEASRLWR